MAALFILWWSRCLRFHHLHQSHLPPPPAILSSTLPPSILSILLPPPTGPSPSAISSYLHYVYHVSTSPLPQNTFVHLFHYISFINLPTPPSTSSESTNFIRPFLSNTLSCLPPHHHPILLHPYLSSTVISTSNHLSWTSLNLSPGSTPRGPHRSILTTLTIRI